MSRLPIGLRGAVMAAAKRLIEIVAEPARQRDVPALPELAERGRAIRLHEIRLEVIAEQARNADGDVAIAGEVAIDLHRVAIKREQEIGPRIGARIEEHAVDQLIREIVGDHHLLEQPEQDQHDAVRDHGAIELGLGLELRQEIGSADDRPGDELREEGDVEEDVERRLLGRDFAAIDVDHIRDAVEGEEGDADREQDLQERQVAFEPDLSEQIGQRLHEEAEIFEEGEDDEIEHNGDDDKLASSPVTLGDREQPPRRVIDQRARGEQHREAPIPARVEDVADADQKGLARFGPFPQLPRRREHAEKEDAETECRKQHAPRSPLTAPRGGAEQRPPAPERLSHRPAADADRNRPSVPHRARRRHDASPRR